MASHVVEASRPKLPRRGAEAMEGLGRCRCYPPAREKGKESTCANCDVNSIVLGSPPPCEVRGTWSVVPSVTAVILRRDQQTFASQHCAAQAAW